MGKRILVDTDVLIEYVKGLKELPVSQLFISEITLYEFIRGTREIGEAKKLLEEGFAVIYHNNSIVLKASEIWKYLKRKGMLIDDRDILIGATAISKNLPLLTNNVRHYERLKEFGLEFFEL